MTSRTSKSIGPRENPKPPIMSFIELGRTVATVKRASLQPGNRERVYEARDKTKIAKMSCSTLIGRAHEWFPIVGWTVSLFSLGSRVMLNEFFQKNIRNNLDGISILSGYDENDSESDAIVYIIQVPIDAQSTSS